MVQRIIAFIFLIITLPLFLILFIIVKISSKGSFLFKQKRVGKNKVPFTIYKIRTMKPSSEKLQSKYLHLNEADGPVFKIRNDPRYTTIGKFLSHTGLDELPQLINIIKGEMAFVGPRPLPVNEAKKIPNKYKKRFSVLPGITSTWIIKGAHTLQFKQWMEEDLLYVQNKSAHYDLYIFLTTIKLVLRLTLDSFRQKMI